MEKLFGFVEDRLSGSKRMTTDEKRMHRAKLLIDLEDAESDLAFSRDKARDMVYAMRTVIDTLEHSVELEPSSGDFTADGDLEIRLSLAQHANFVTVAAAGGVISEMKKCRQSVFNLRERKRKLVLL
jgi:hypothetical protein